MRAKATTKVLSPSSFVYNGQSTTVTYNISDSILSGNIYVIYDQNMYFKRECGLEEDLEKIVNDYRWRNITAGLLLTISQIATGLLERYRAAGELFTDDDVPLRKEGEIWIKLYGQDKFVFENS